MDFERFKEWALEDVSSRLPGEFEDAELYFEEVKKFGSRYTGLFLKKSGSVISPTVNMEQFYGFYLNGAAKEELASAMADMLQYHVIENDIDLDWITDYDKAKEHLFVCLSNAENDHGFLEETPHIRKSDLALTCHILSEIPEEGHIGTLVNDSLLEEYGIDEDQLFRDAIENSMKIMPSEVKFSRDIIDEKQGREEDDQFYDMMVISNKEHYRGSAVLFYPGVLERIALELKGSFYVIPSSIHEVLAIPASKFLDTFSLQQLIVETNLMYVPGDEKLSDNLYYYDAGSGEFMIAKAEEQLH